MRRLRFILLAALALILGMGIRAVSAHSGQPIAPHDLWSAWNGDTLLLLTLEMSVLVYVWGVALTWRRAGRGRGIGYRRVAAFFGGVLALVLALVSPLDALSGALFTAHMVQHMLLLLVAAPLLVFSDFPLAALRVLPAATAQTLARGWNRARGLLGLLGSPLVAWVLFNLMIWLWHAPALYQAALADESIHRLEHACFLIAAVLFWRMLADASRPRHTRYVVAVAALFTSGMAGGILGALLTFADQPWYPLYADRAAAWGLTVLQDQQIAGLVMWVPVGTLFTLAALLYAAAWLRTLETRRPSVPVQNHSATGASC